MSGPTRNLLSRATDFTALRYPFLKSAIKDHEAQVITGFRQRVKQPDHPVLSDADLQKRLTDSAKSAVSGAMMDFSDVIQTWGGTPDFSGRVDLALERVSSSQVIFSNDANGEYYRKTREARIGCKGLFSTKDVFKRLVHELFHAAECDDMSAMSQSLGESWLPQHLITLAQNLGWESFHQDLQKNFGAFVGQDEASLTLGYAARIGMELNVDLSAVRAATTLQRGGLMLPDEFVSPVSEFVAPLSFEMIHAPLRSRVSSHVMFHDFPHFVFADSKQRTAFDRFFVRLQAGAFFAAAGEKKDDVQEYFEFEIQAAVQDLGSEEFLFFLFSLTL
jgi:hypothetical protein